MDASESHPLTLADGSRKRANALELGPRKKPYAVACLVTRHFSQSLLFSCTADPLVHHGRHFCRTVHALCNIQALLTNGVARMVELADAPETELTAESVVHIPYLFLFAHASQRTTRTGRI